MSEVRERIIVAHGGRTRWDAVERLMACLSVGGTAFLTHLNPPPLQDAEVTLAPATGVITIAPFSRPSLIGGFDGERVWLEDEGGEVVRQREMRVPAARSLRHWFIWDELDMLFVTAVTLSQAMLFPWLLGREGVVDETRGPVWPERQRLDRVDARFPEGTTLSSPQLRLYADGTGLIWRIDYAPVAYGGWFRVGQVMEGHEVFDGLVLPMRQTLYPCLMNSQLWRAARLIWLRLEDVTVAYRAVASRLA